MSLPGISIVMPLLNQRAFLEASVRSVMEQPVERLELIVMDGGSSDGSLPLLAELAQRHSGRLRWFSALDSGPAQALNRAVAQARHEVLGWLPADDLYTPRAVLRALQALHAHPDWRIVYGHGEHVDLQGASLGPYPSRTPDVPLQAFAEGCFVCQPTLFMWRSVWQDVGGLDESLRASFDFELWLRLFRLHAGRIGFIDAVQAQSRLHDAGITLRQRERVALEGLQVLQRHLGQAPIHWLLTHFEECLREHPFQPQAVDLRRSLPDLLGRASPFLSEADRVAGAQWLADHAALRIGSPELALEVDADGWVRQRAWLRLRAAPPQARVLRLSGCNRHPRQQALLLRVRSPNGAEQRLQVPADAPFDLDINLPQQWPEQRGQWLIETLPGFVPAELEAASGDRRSLGFRVDSLGFVT